MNWFLEWVMDRLLFPLRKFPPVREYLGRHQAVHWRKQRVREEANLTHAADRIAALRNRA